MGDKTGGGVCRASRQRAFDRAGDAPPFKCGSKGVRVTRCHARFASNVDARRAFNTDVRGYF